jgi:hypothetical protein
MSAFSHGWSTAGLQSIELQTEILQKLVVQYSGRLGTLVLARLSTRSQLLSNRICRVLETAKSAQLAPSAA